MAERKVEWGWLGRAPPWLRALLATNARVLSMELRPCQNNDVARLEVNGLTRAVFGQSTVWHDAESGERQPAWIEQLLADRWELERPVFSARRRADQSRVG